MQQAPPGFAPLITVLCTRNGSQSFPFPVLDAKAPDLAAQLSSPAFVTFSSGETAEGRALQRYAQGPGIEPLAKMAEEIPPSAILLSTPRDGLNGFEAPCVIWGGTSDSRVPRAETQATRRVSSCSKRAARRGKRRPTASNCVQLRPRKSGPEQGTHNKSQVSALCPVTLPR